MLIDDLEGLRKQFDSVVGMTTFSGQLVDDDAKSLVKAQLRKLLLDKLERGEKVLVVIGATNLGGVKDGYDLLEEDVFKLYREKGQLKTMGLVAGMGVLAAHLSQSKNNPYGIRNTDYVYVHGFVLQGLR